jgi:PIN domain nuclease of toxin-antitoxin system
VRLLLDTHVFIWSLMRPRAISAGARNAIISAESEVFVSAATAWEIAIKRAAGKIDFPIDQFVSILDEKGYLPLAIDSMHAVTAGGLPPHHSDPFDRMLVAQALVEGLTVATADPVIAKYGVETLAG